MRALASLMLTFVACRTDSIASDTPVRSDGGSGVSAPAEETAFHGIGVKARGVELVPAPPGDVAALVRAARKTARAHGRSLLVYIGATWCEPCQRFHHAAEEGKLDDTFPTMSLLVFDLDADGNRLHAALYAPGYVPYFGVPDESGRATGKALAGSIKGEGAVAQMTPRLLELVAQSVEGGAP
jgi:thiol-disulfide isomerase/thioredoxin